MDLVSNIKVGGAEAQATDVLGRVYEYFLEQFALAEARKGGEFYTPRSVVRLLVEMLEPYQGRVYDPCCGSSGMFVQSVEFIRAHATGNGNGGRARGDISIYGQESNHTTWRLARMNLAIRGIEGQIAFGDSFTTTATPTCGLTTSWPTAFQRLGLGRTAVAGRPAVAVWHPAGGKRQLRLGTALPVPPGAPGHRRIRAGQRLHVVQPVG